MIANFVKCPYCGWLHEARVVDGLVDTTLLSCPFQPKNKVTLVGDESSPRGVVTIELGESLGE